MDDGPLQGIRGALDGTDESRQWQNSACTSIPMTGKIRWELGDALLLGAMLVAFLIGTLLWFVFVH